MAFSLGREVNLSSAPGNLSWRLPQPFTGVHRVEPEEIDEYEHVNNTVYLRWLDTIAWAHSMHLGMSMGLREMLVALVASIIMTAVSSLFAIRRLWRVDPIMLFE